MNRGSSLAIRLLAACGVWLLLAASTVAVSLQREQDDAAAQTARDTQPGSRSGPHGTPGSDARRSLVLPTDPEVAEAMGGDDLLAAGESTAAGPWSDLGGNGAIAGERPVYVVRAELPSRSRVEVDLVVAVRVTEPTRSLTLRALPLSDALAAPVDLTVRRDGQVVDHVEDGSSATLTVHLDPVPAPGEAVLLRITLAYDIPHLDDLGDTGGPLAYGLLAAGPSSTTLGHWLPLLTFETNRPVEWGDVGSFPPAVWSLTVLAEDPLVSGGHETPCTDIPRDCVWIRGVALREIALVVFDDLVTARTTGDGLTLRVALPTGGAAAAPVLTEVSAASMSWMTDRLGSLAWRSVTVAVVPFGRGAAGMEFPGLVLISTDVVDRLDGGFGEIVVAHEIAHQWFHGLVGNLSLAEPVVDEATAQYLTYAYWAERHGQEAASLVARSLFVDPYVSALAGGMDDAPPLQHAGDFPDADVYGILVYSRAPLGLIAAERATDRDAVLGFLAALVSRHGLGQLDAATMLEEATLADPRIGDALRRWWTEPSPGAGAAVQVVP